MQRPPPVHQLQPERGDHLERWVLRLCGSALLLFCPGSGWFELVFLNVVSRFKFILQKQRFFCFEARPKFPFFG